MSAKIIPLRAYHPVKRQDATPTAFDRQELSIILNIYGQMVAGGYWKDYAIDMLKDRAVFSIYRRATETPLYQINKRPALRAKNGLYSVVAPGGLILKRGNNLRTVLRIFDKKRFL